MEAPRVPLPLMIPVRSLIASKTISKSTSGGEP
jgi:hypothetical protein